MTFAYHHICSPLTFLTFFPPLFPFLQKHSLLWQMDRELNALSQWEGLTLTGPTDLEGGQSSFCWISEKYSKTGNRIPAWYLIPYRSLQGTDPSAKHSERKALVLSSRQQLLRRVMRQEGHAKAPAWTWKTGLKWSWRQDEKHECIYKCGGNQSYGYKQQKSQLKKFQIKW